ncbi:MAG: electron transfer flavoprotein subunit beta/FixA family protein [Bryobacteraceae bacterium]|nr:electron transfer flavoprotein subunit beta/FixA family protein [Solibacteraceae bacterium]MCL4793419.1 electron transfer flavoprotein subunit beta/FixA family protein [Bryobacteraceae bacterium]
MKILVALKQVPARDSLFKVDAAGRWIDTADLSYEINEPDAYALESGLRLKEQHGGEVVALCAGPEGAASAIREALAKGADRAIHIQDDNLLAYDSLSLGRMLAAAARAEAPDLILTGLQSDDIGSGQTGVILAEVLGLPHATIIMDIEVHDGALRVKRELEDGWFQHVALPRPAVLTVQSGSSKLRYATLMGIKKAKTKEIKVVSAPELGVAPEAGAVLERLSLPERTKRTVLLEGTPEQQAAALVEKLKHEVRAL